jgi:hypothetical protein
LKHQKIAAPPRPAAGQRHRLFRAVRPGQYKITAAAKWTDRHTRRSPDLEATLFAGEQRNGLIPHLEEVCGLRGGAFGVAQYEPGLVSQRLFPAGSLTRASASCSMTSNAAVTVGSAAP